MSNSAVFFVPAARCCARVLSHLSHFSVGWVERQRHPSPALAGPGPMGFAHGAQPILRNSYLPFLRSRDIRARVLPSFSASSSPTEGMAERREAVSFILSRA